MCDILTISCLIQVSIILTLLGLTAAMFFYREIKRGKRLQKMKKRKSLIPSTCIYIGLDMSRTNKKMVQVVGVEKKIKTNKYIFV